MITRAKVLVPNKFWILENGGEKLATLSKEKKGYSLLCRGQKFEVHDLKEIKERFGISVMRFHMILPIRGTMKEE